MTIQEFINRLRDRARSYWFSEKRSVKVASRLLAFSLFGALISTVAPTLADELSSDPQMLQPVTSQETFTVTNNVETPTPATSANPTLSPDPQISRPPIEVTSESPLPESTDSATAAGPGQALTHQPTYILRIPQSAAIDPRASTYFLPHITVSVDDPDALYTLACISGVGAEMDIVHKKSPDNSLEGDDLISGDGSALLLVSATTNRVINLINSYNGAFITSSGGGLAGRSLIFRFVAVSKPVIDPLICSKATNGVVMSMRAIGLDISTVKGKGKLK